MERLPKAEISPELRAGVARLIGQLCSMHNPTQATLSLDSKPDFGMN